MQFALTITDRPEAPPNNVVMFHNPPVATPLGRDNLFLGAVGDWYVPSTAIGHSTPMQVLQSRDAECLRVPMFRYLLRADAAEKLPNAHLFLVGVQLGMQALQSLINSKIMGDGVSPDFCRILIHTESAEVVYCGFAFRVNHPR